MWDFKQFNVEIPLFFVFFSFMLSDSVGTNLIIYRTCYISLGYNKSDCALLGSQNINNETATLEKLVEPHAAIIRMVSTTIQCIFCGVFCLFIGPWSDKFGRKPFQILTLIGFTLNFVFFSIFAEISSLSPWYSLICSVPSMVTGGISTYISIVLCYIADVTSVAKRGFRMGVFEAVLSIGILAGNTASSYVFNATSYLVVYIISALCCLFSTIFTIFLVSESLPQTEDNTNSSSNNNDNRNFKDLFNLTNFIEMVKTTFKKRQNNDRTIILLSLLLLTIFIVTVNADGAVIFLYLRQKFHWSLQKYTLYSSFHNVAWILGIIIGVYIFHKLLKITETVLILIGFMSMLNGTLLQGLAKDDWVIYAAGGVRGLGGVLSPMGRSLVSKIVATHEIGKIFSLIVTSESFFSMLSSPIYTTIYNATIKTNSGLFNYISASIYGFEIILTLIIIYLHNYKRASYGHLDENTQGVN